MLLNFRLLQKSRGFRLLLIGAPGSGKGYISDKIVATIGAVHIAPGDILRQHINKGTVLGKKVDAVIKKGLLVPDSLVGNVMSIAIFKANMQNMILDGYPRTLEQAKHLDSLAKVDMAINAHVPEEAILKLLKNRLIHPASGRIYNKITETAPKVPGQDDITGERLERRADDQPEVVKARLAAFEQQIQPVIRHYKKKNILHTISVKKHESLWPLVHKALEKLWRKNPERCVKPPRSINLIQIR